MFGWVQNMFKIKFKFLSPPPPALSPAFLPSPPLNKFFGHGIDNHNSTSKFNNILMNKNKCSLLLK
jgi:hypothetical protein